MSTELCARRSVAGAALCLVLAALLLGAAPPPEGSPRIRAAAHFERGLQLMQAGDPVSARQEFEEAYAASPHYSTLLNLAQAHAALGSPVRAITALRRYLEDGKERIDEPRRRAAEQLIQTQEERVGFLRLDVKPDGAEIFLDGERVGTAPLQQPVPVEPGRHGLVVRADGLSTYAEPVDVKVKSTTEVSAHLSGTGAAPPSQGHLELTCEVPDVKVSVDGAVRSRPSLLLTAGSHRVRFEREGYVPHELTVRVGPAASVRATCRLRVDPDRRHPRGALALTGLPSGSKALVDGAPFSGVPLPTGRHRVTVSAPGYLAWKRDAVIRPGAVSPLTVSLSLTPEHRRELARQASRRDVLGIGLTAGGAAFIGGAAGIYLWNGNRYDEWKRDRAAAYGALAASPAPSNASRLASVESRSAGLQQMDDVAVGLGIAGAAALVTGVVLLLTGDGAPPPAPALPAK